MICRVNFMATNASPEDIILYHHCWQGQSQIDTLYRRTLLCYCLHQQELWGPPIITEHLNLVDYRSCRVWNNALIAL